MAKEICFYYDDGDLYCKEVSECPKDDAEVCYLLSRAGAEDLVCREV